MGLHVHVLVLLSKILLTMMTIMVSEWVVYVYIYVYRTGELIFTKEVKDVYTYLQKWNNGKQLMELQTTDWKNESFVIRVPWSHCAWATIYYAWTIWKAQQGQTIKSKVVVVIVDKEREHVGLHTLLFHELREPLKLELMVDFREIRYIIM